MRDVPGFVIHGAPRTKKNHGNIVSIPKPGSRKCYSCGHRPGFPKIMPSPQYQDWEAAAVVECMTIKPKLRAAGIDLPITDPVSVEAHIYRERATGDAAGYIQAIGDMLQEVGILKDDALIDDWDGTRRLKDAINPRVEIFITILQEQPRQLTIENTTGEGILTRVE